jgi:catechol 2,3-dioxygenase-like lactoylglutathione lyase family enzyme
VELVEVIVYLRDMGRAIRFYRDTLGLEVEFESPFWTTFRTGACTLALHAIDDRRVGTAEPDPTFLVRDVDGERARLRGAGVEVGDVREPAPGVRVFDVRDPDGNRFSLESRNA